MNLRAAPFLQKSGRGGPAEVPGLANRTGGPPKGSGIPAGGAGAAARWSDGEGVPLGVAGGSVGSSDVRAGPGSPVARSSELTEAGGAVSGEGRG